MRMSTRTRIITLFVVMSVRILETFDSLGGLNVRFIYGWSYFLLWLWNEFEGLLTGDLLIFSSISWNYPLESLLAVFISVGYTFFFIFLFFIFSSNLKLPFEELFLAYWSSWASLYTFNIRINLTNLTTLPALDPTLEACPALAIPFTYPPLEESIALLIKFTSKTIESVERRSSQKKNEQM